MTEEERARGEVRTIEQVGTWSLAKITGLMVVLWGIIIAIPLVALGGPFGASLPVGDVAVLVVGAGLYGTFGGALSAVIYNLAAEVAGGIKIRIE